MKLVLISHFYNEEMLLPYWLQHHVELFDHGIMIDYNSTDNSCDIIRELAPDWEIRQSKNDLFTAEKCDWEVMDIERSLGECWKMALNTTEFVFLDNLRSRINYLSGEFPNQRSFAFNNIVMTDGPDDKHRMIITDSSLVLQRHYGYYPADTRQWRCIHCHDDGKYSTGRHGSVQYNWLIDDSCILWFGWTPYAIARERRLKIQLQIPMADLFYGRGVQHLLTPDEFDDQYKRQCLLGDDLFKSKQYRREYIAINKAFA